MLMKKIIMMLLAMLICMITSAQISLQDVKCLWTEYDFMHANKARVYSRLKAEKHLDFRLLSQPKREYISLLTQWTLKSADLLSEQLLFEHIPEYMKKNADEWFQKIVEFKKNEAEELVFSADEDAFVSAWLALLYDGTVLNNISSYIETFDEEWFLSQKSSMTEGFFYRDDIFKL